MKLQPGLENRLTSTWICFRYENTNFRLALIPATTFEDAFKLATDDLWRSIYVDRLQPHLEEYLSYPNYLVDMVHFITDDFETALYDSYQAIRLVNL